MELQRYLKYRGRLIEKALDSYLPPGNMSPSIIHRAMRYSVFSGGKRIRPIFAIAACEACGGAVKDVISTACAIEIIHTYSLIHDDLPSMDNADMRRNKPSCHKKFGEAIAVLAGDALLTLAFKLADVKVIKDICDAIGTEGMIGGQALEIQNSRFEIQNLKRISEMKTGALIAVSTKVGAILAGANARQLNALFTFGKCTGLAFQIIDDVLDCEGYAQAAGKAQATHLAQSLNKQAKDSLDGAVERKDILCMLADYVVNREN